MLELKVNGHSVFNIDVNGENLSLDNKEVNWDVIEISKNHYNIVKDNKSYNIEVIEEEDKSYKILINEHEYEVGVKNDLDLLLEKMGISTSANTVENELKAPMPGLVLDIKVEVGQEIKEGDAILVLEAMKMENILKSPADVIIKSIEVEKGNNVEKNQVLVEFE